MKRNDYTGQKFGDLTVVEMLYGYGSHGEAYCKCVCTCGNECIKSSYNLRRSRNPAHCGCKTQDYIKAQAARSRIDLTGQKFGRLTVVAMIAEPGSMSRAVCRCDCGNEIIRPVTYLTTGDTTSCGCWHKKRTSEENTKDWTGHVSKHGVEFIQPLHQNNHGTWVWQCRCGLCGRLFEEIPARVMSGHVSSCGCARASYGEKLIQKALTDSGVVFDTEHALDSSAHPQRLDFYIPSLSVGIEYQGIQHYEPIDFFGGESGYNRRVILDRKKREYCKSHSIQLVEIPYYLEPEEIIQKITNIIYPERLSCDAQ